jgi:hypothetical protein
MIILFSDLPPKLLSLQIPADSSGLLIAAHGNLRGVFTVNKTV